ncbi:N utilization substance protein B homolog [Chlamydiales bacterium SCGC AG-110-M15]|nr:N utilization substance protein B homolog [Chlamydiales bacterium SCGC AG-110-M15]
MAIPLKKFRELVFQLMHPNDAEQLEDDEFLSLMMAELSVTKRVVLLAIERVKQIRSHSEKIDEMVSQVSESYDFSRIQRVERTILRLSVFELLYDDEIPPKVAISEALRLARKFSTPEAANFLNAILDTLYKKSLGENPDQDVLSKSIEELVRSEESAKEAAKQRLEDESKH